MFTPLNSPHSFAGLVKADKFKTRLYNIWFSLFPGQAKINPKLLTSSCFEHVFMGETKDFPHK